MRWRVTFAFAACIACTGAHAAETFPDRPVRFLIPFAPAGSNDVVARILAHQLTDIWKQ